MRAEAILPKPTKQNANSHLWPYSLLAPFYCPPFLLIPQHKHLHLSILTLQSQVVTL